MSSSHSSDGDGGVNGGGDVSDEVRSNQVLLAPSGSSVGQGPPSEGSNHHEYDQRQQQQQQQQQRYNAGQFSNRRLEDEEGGRGRGAPKGRGDVEMSPVREESPLRAAVAVVGGAGYVRNVGGAGPVGYGENMGGAGPVGYGGNVGGVDGVGGRSFRGQGYGAVQGGGRRAGDGDGDGLEQPLLGHARNRECLAVYWRDSASLCTWKVQCCGALSLLLIAAVTLILAIGIGLMFTNEKREIFYMYTTANEANRVYSQDDVTFMRSVCIENQGNGLDENWILFTDSCGKIDATRRNFKFSHEIRTATGYYFALAKDSDVKLTFNPANGTANFQMEKNAKRAFTDIDRDCGRENGKPLQETVFPDSGYYYICVVPKSTPLAFSIDINELYYQREPKTVCNDTVYNTAGIIQRKCCNFGFSSDLNCVYLTTRNTEPILISQPHQVTVHLKYNEAVKTLMVVVLVAMLVALCAVVATVYCLRFKVRRGVAHAAPPPQQH